MNEDGVKWGHHEGQAKGENQTEFWLQQMMKTHVLLKTIKVINS